MIEVGKRNTTCLRRARKIILFILINDQIINSQGRDFFKCKGGVRRVSFTGLSWTQVLIVLNGIQTSICFIWILLRFWELEGRELKIFLVFVLPLGKFLSWFHVLRFGFGFGFGFLRSDWAFNKLLRRVDEISIWVSAKKFPLGYRYTSFTFLSH